ncbi:hypothetical protein V1478_004824 [Vespula squamosa]|uniref:Uncharacterized protein n=1 Tax=Vespula squamosa TaxID=30214 RepID=A0ABD2BF41_VESSQ
MGRGGWFTGGFTGKRRRWLFVGGGGVGVQVEGEEGVKSERGEPVEPLNRVFREIYEIRADKVGNKSKSLKDVAPKKGKSSGMVQWGWDGVHGEEEGHREGRLRVKGLQKTRFEYNGLV